MCASPPSATADCVRSALQFVGAVSSSVPGRFGEERGREEVGWLLSLFGTTWRSAGLVLDPLVHAQLGFFLRSTKPGSRASHQ